MIHKHKCSDDTDVIIVQFDQPRGKITLGGDRRLQMRIWNVYVGCFGECDGEPSFHEVTRGKTRITFNCSFKNYQNALANMRDDGFEIEDIENIDRMM